MQDEKPDTILPRVSAASFARGGLDFSSDECRCIAGRFLSGNQMPMRQGVAMQHLLVMRPILVMLTILVTACGGGSDVGSSPAAPPPPPAPRLATLSVGLAASSVVAGTTTTASASGRDQFGQPIATGTVAWSSSAPSVASVDQAGVVTGVSSGAATITATAGGVSGTAALTVSPAPVLTRLTVTLAAPTITSSTRVTITVAGFDQFNAPIAVPAVTWTSSDPAVATVALEGAAFVAIGARVGTTTLTARAGGVTGTAPITVTAGSAARLSILRSAAGVFSNWRFTTQPQIEITDQAGNRITTDNATVVQLAATGGLIGTATATAVAGVATFVNVGVTAAIGSTPTLSFSSGTLAGASQAVTVAPFTFGNGVRLVNTEIRPGRYRSVNAASASCYWARLRNTTGTNDIIANDIGAGPRLLEVLSSDVALESSRCGTWTEITGPVTTSRTADMTDGVYLVGVDIEPGTWRAPGPGENCYWARLRNINGNDNLIANYFGGLPAIMTILPTDVAVEVSRCGTWSRVP